MIHWKRIWKQSWNKQATIPESAWRDYKTSIRIASESNEIWTGQLINTSLCITATQICQSGRLGESIRPINVKRKSITNTVQGQKSAVLLINSEKSPYEKTLYGSHHANDKDSLVGTRDCMPQGKKTGSKRPVEWI